MDRPEGERPTALRTFTLSSLEGLEPEWDALRSPWGPPTGQFAWVRSWFETFGEDYELAVVVAARGSQTLAILPLVRRVGVPRLEMASVHELWEPADALGSDPDAVEQALATALGSGRTSLSLKRVPSASPLVAAARRKDRALGVTVSYRMPGCPVIFLDRGWTEPEGQFNARRRADFRRAARLAEREGKVTFDLLAPVEDEVPSLLAECFAVESANWKGRKGTALAHRPRARAFYERYAAAAARRGMLRIQFLRVDGTAAAMHLAVQTADRLWLLKMGYDERFARCSPGTLLLLRSIADAADAGLRSFEFFGTAQPWTRMWTEMVRPLTGVRLYRLGWSGAKLGMADGLAALRRRATPEESGPEPVTG